MPIQFLSGKEALRQATRNTYRQFNTKPDDETTAGYRLWNLDRVPIHHDPKFMFGPTDGIFTLGSCFARNVEFMLMQQGFNVLLKDWRYPKEWFNPNHQGIQKILSEEGEDHHFRMVLNRYSPLSMFAEFSRVLDPDYDSAEGKGLVSVGDNLFIDPFIKSFMSAGWDLAVEMRTHVDNAARLIKQADVLLLTLGLTESWMDEETGMIWNTAPDPSVIMRHSDRFRFFNATVAESVQALENLYALLTSRVNPDIKLVVTVSPVPLGTTFSGMDVITANSYSKSTLRAAAGEFCANHVNDNVDYFPSYEIVTSSRPDVVWLDDRVHVQDDMVQFVISRFIKAYTAAEG